MKATNPDMFNYLEWLRSKAEAELPLGLVSLENLITLLACRKKELYEWCKEQKELKEKVQLEGFPEPVLKINFTKEELLRCLYRIERENKDGLVEVTE